MLCVALAGLGLLAAISVALSALPWPAKPALAACALGYGAWLARREWRRPRCSIEVGPGGGAVMRVGASEIALQSPRLALRGVLATLTWRSGEGRRHSLAWCADNLPAASRRRLRLHFGTRADGAAA